MADTFPQESTLVALFELTQGFAYTDDHTQCPQSLAARRIWFRPSTGHYGSSAISSGETIHHPLALQNAAGEYLGLPLGRAGQRYWCWWNGESGRWEIFAPSPPTAYWATVVEWRETGRCAVQLTVGGVAQGLVAARYQGSTPPALGSTVRVEWFPEEDAWYVVS